MVLMSVNKEIFFNKPILLIGYSRPKLTLIQINLLRTIRPNKLYFYIDGPKNNQEKILMQETIKSLNLIDWPTVLKKNIELESSGAAKSITKAITCAFESENELIILEDDVIPCPEFFNYCSFYLDEDLRQYGIGAISGHQIENKISQKYLTSKLSIYPRVWGWATQKTIWNEFNYKNNLPWNKFMVLALKISNYNIIFFFYLLFVYNKILRKKIDTWDYQFLFYLYQNKYKVIVPSSNLIRNLGFGPNSTHTKISRINQTYQGSGLEIKLDRVSDLEYEKNIDKNWRKYRINVLRISAIEKMRRRIIKK